MHSHADDSIRGVLFSLCESIDSARALAVWLCFEYDHDALIELISTQPCKHSTESFQKDYFISEYLSKYKGLKPSVDPKVVASDRWMASEIRCKQTNKYFRTTLSRAIDARAEGLIFRAQRKIAQVLGNLSYSSLTRNCKWGPGATFDVKRVDADPGSKMSFPISVTSGALGLLRANIEADPNWAEGLFGLKPDGPFRLLPSCFCLVRGSRTIFVPKSAKTHRPIAAEPTGNSFLQQGIRSYLRRRLERFGVRLDDQSINQRLAADAAFKGYATLDLSAASDSISTEFVRSILPLDWFCFLDSIRSHETNIDGTWIKTEKFVSMGNAFCFELETLLFWALSQASAESTGGGAVSVYGDDLIVSQATAPVLVELLEYCGFSVNSKKSFSSGMFFESCGKHYYSGADVTPVYQKELLDTPSEVIRAHNRLVRLRDRSSIPITQGTLTIVRALFKRKPFPRIPFGAVEDGGFLVEKRQLPFDVNRGYLCDVMDFIPNKLGIIDPLYLAYQLRHPSYVTVQPGFRASGGKWRSRKRWIWLSALDPDYQVRSDDSRS